MKGYWLTTSIAVIRYVKELIQQFVHQEMRDLLGWLNPFGNVGSIQHLSRCSLYPLRWCWIDGSVDEVNCAKAIKQVHGTPSISRNTAGALLLRIQCQQSGHTGSGKNNCPLHSQDDPRDNGK